MRDSDEINKECLAVLWVINWMKSGSRISLFKWINVAQRIKYEQFLKRSLDF